MKYNISHFVSEIRVKIIYQEHLNNCKRKMSPRKNVRRVGRSRSLAFAADTIPNDMQFLVLNNLNYYFSGNIYHFKDISCLLSSIFNFTHRNNSRQYIDSPLSNNHIWNAINWYVSLAENE